MFVSILEQTPTRLVLKCSGKKNPTWIPITLGGSILIACCLIALTISLLISYLNLDIPINDLSGWLGLASVTFLWSSVSFWLTYYFLYRSRLVEVATFDLDAGILAIERKAIFTKFIKIPIPQIEGIYTIQDKIYLLCRDEPLIVFSRYFKQSKTTEIAKIIQDFLAIEIVDTKRFGRVQVLQTSRKLHLRTFSKSFLFDKLQENLTIKTNFIYIYTKLTKLPTLDIDGVYIFEGSRYEGSMNLYTIYLLCNTQSLYLFDFQDKSLATKVTETIQNFLGTDIVTVVQSGKVNIAKSKEKLFLVYQKNYFLFNKNQGFLIIREKKAFRTQSNEIQISQIEGIYLHQVQGEYLHQSNVYLLCSGKSFHLLNSLNSEKAQEISGIIRDFLGFKSLIEKPLVIHHKFVRILERSSTKLAIKQSRWINFLKSVKSNSVIVFVVFIFLQILGNLIQLLRESNSDITFTLLFKVFFFILILVLVILSFQFFKIEICFFDKDLDTLSIKKWLIFSKHTKIPISQIEGIFILNLKVYVWCQGKLICLFGNFTQESETSQEIVRVIQDFIDLETVKITQVDSWKVLQTQAKLLLKCAPTNKARGFLFCGLVLLFLSSFGTAWSVNTLLAPSNLLASSLICEQSQSGYFGCALTGNYTFGSIKQKITKEEFATATVESDAIALRTSTGELRLLADSEDLRNSVYTQMRTFSAGNKNTLKLKLWGVNFIYWHGSFVILSLVGVFVSLIIIGRNFYILILSQTCIFDKNLDSLIVKRKAFRTEQLTIPISQIAWVETELGNVKFQTSNRLQVPLFLSHYPLDASTASWIANLIRNFLG